MIRGANLTPINVKTPETSARFPGLDWAVLPVGGWPDGSPTASQAGPSRESQAPDDSDRTGTSARTGARRAGGFLSPFIGYSGWPGPGRGSSRRRGGHALRRCGAGTGENPAPLSRESSSRVKRGGPPGRPVRHASLILPCSDFHPDRARFDRRLKSGKVPRAA